MEKYGLLFESIFKRKLTDEHAAGYLENITKEHPYFSVAQFFLLRLSQKNVNGYKKQARKAAVLFNNNHWLNFQLLEAGFDNSTTAETGDPLSFPEKIADNVFAATVDNIHSEAAPTETYTAAQPWLEAAVETEEAAKEVQEIKIEEEITAAESGRDEPVVINEPLIVGDNNTVDEVINDETALLPIAGEQPAAVMEEITIQAELKAEESIGEEPGVKNEFLIAGEENNVDEIISDDTATVEPELRSAETVLAHDIKTIEEVVADEQEAVTEQIITVPHAECNEGAVVQENEAVAENAGAVEAPVNEIITAIPGAAGEKPAPAAEEAAQTVAVAATSVVNDKVTVTEPLLFEPLHTSDYFASVGIKLSEEEKTAGNLGKQLKSFTDWLKTMKKVHAEQLTKTTSPVEVSLSAAESSIQKMAEKSNQENDVITEAMSDVLFQQGKADKAVEILEKLSLLNPGKSAYFAAKINQIKDK